MATITARKTTQRRAAAAFAAGQTVVIHKGSRRELPIHHNTVTHHRTGSVTFAELADQAAVWSASFYVVSPAS